MNLKPVSSVVTIVLGALLVVAPSIVSGNGPMSYDQAFAEAGGNGNSHGQGGNANGKSVASNGNAASNSNGQGKIASKLGALNAAHASARAFAHASPDSRIGKIKAYYLANQTAGVQKQAFLDALTTNSVTLAQFNAVEPAYLALQGELTNAALLAAYNLALTTAGITDVQVVALQADYNSWQAADALATTALNTAANKTPVSDATRAALDILLAGKIY